MLTIEGIQTIELQDFSVYISSLPLEIPRVALVRTPYGFSVKGTERGINTYRANAMLRGSAMISKADMMPLVRNRGESPQESRIAIAGDYWMTGLEEDSAFVCIVAKNPRSMFYDYSIEIIEPGNSLTIPVSDYQRNLFIFEGALTLGEQEYTGFRHLRPSMPREYVFANHGDVPVFAISMPEIGLQAAKDLVLLHYPDNASDFVFMGD